MPFVWSVVSELMFCIQLFVAQLLFVTWSERRPHFAPKFAAIAAACIVFFCLVPSDSMALECLKYGGGFCFLLVIVIVCFKTTVNYALFASVCAYAVQHIMYCVCEMVRSLFDISAFLVNRLAPGAGDFINIYMPLNMAVTAIIFTVGYVALYFAFIRRLRKSRRMRVSGVGQIALSVVVLASTMAINIFYRRFFPDIPVAAALCLRVFAIISCVFAIVIQLRTREKSELEETNELLDHLLYAEAKRHEMTKENIELINIKCHDLKKQINTLKRIVGEEEKAESIAEIEKAVMIYDTSAKTGNEGLDVVLTEKSLICESEKIRFTYMADGSKLSMMKTGDIFTLFSNALDNAIAGVRKLPEEKRIISLRVDQVGEMLRISMFNYFEGELQFADGLPKSTSGDEQFHGFGLKSIRYIAQKYGGTFRVSAENNIFEIGVLIPEKGRPVTD